MGNVVYLESQERIVRENITIRQTLRSNLLNISIPWDESIPQTWRGRSEVELSTV